VKIGLHTLLLLSLTCCAGVSPDAPTVETTDYPLGWPRPIEADIEGDECGSVDGTYQSGGKSNSEIGERFTNPIFERNFFHLNDIANPSNYFIVSHVTEGNRLVFEIFDRIGELLVSGLQKRYSSCEQGWFVIESRVTGGSGDSPVKSTYRRTKIGKAIDGSLLINSYSEGVWREFLLGTKTRTSNIWYKFEEAEENSDLPN
jgi:hypothetical protein